MALAGGLVALVLGIIGIIVWWGQLIHLLAGAVPLMFILGGALAAYFGIEELKNKKSTESFDTEKDDPKQEEETLRDEIEEFKTEEAEPPDEDKE